MEYNNYSPYPPYELSGMENQNLNDNFFNPSAQYEQAYMYYRYLEKQMDYKIKCKEYENLLRNEQKNKG